MAIMSKVCGGCNRSIKLEVREQDYFAYKGGALVQNAFPYLSIADRELLISGTCGTCFDNMFGSFDEFDDDEEVGA